jgi:hypothetical protein
MAVVAPRTPCVGVSAELELRVMVELLVAESLSAAGYGVMLAALSKLSQNEAAHFLRRCWMASKTPQIAAMTTNMVGIT